MEVLQADESVESGRDCSCTAPHRTWPQGNDRRQDFSSSRRSELTIHLPPHPAVVSAERCWQRGLDPDTRMRHPPRTTARSQEDLTYPVPKTAAQPEAPAGAAWVSGSD